MCAARVEHFLNLISMVLIYTKCFSIVHRSHSFAVRSRPAHLEGVTIHNVNVRGKRGNIVQVYPGVEYDFVPNTLTVREGDYVHYQ